MRISVDSSMRLNQFLLYLMTFSEFAPFDKNVNCFTNTTQSFLNVFPQVVLA